MVRQISDFIQEWSYESESTLKLFNHIPDEFMATKDHEHIRSIARLAWHITITISEMMTKAGLQVTGPHEDSEPPANMKEIIEAYKASSTSLLVEIKKAWNDQDLEKEVNMYGEIWNLGTVLSVLIRHQAHHRGLLTILMRLAGMKVIGVYGPSKEEWADMGIPAME